MVVREACDATFCSAARQSYILQPLHAHDRADKTEHKPTRTRISRKWRKWRNSQNKEQQTKMHKTRITQRSCQEKKVRKTKIENKTAQAKANPEQTLSKPYAKRRV